MGLNEYLNVFRKNGLFIIITVVIFAGAALLLTLRQPVNYQSSAAIEVSRHQVQDQSRVGYFLYDNFYNSEVTKVLSDNIVGLISSPSIVADTYKAAGYAIPPVSSKDLGKTFTAKKNIDQSSVVLINYSSTDKTKAEKMVTTLTDVIKQNVEKNNSQDTSARNDVNTTDTVVLATPKSFALNSVIAGFVGLFVAVSIAFLRHAVKK